MAGDEHAGCSVHLVTADLDSGPVVAQAKVRILPRDDADSLAARVLEDEHRLYPLALEEYCRALREARGAWTPEAEAQVLERLPAGVRSPRPGG